MVEIKIIKMNKKIKIKIENVYVILAYVLIIVGNTIMSHTNNLDVYNDDLSIIQHVIIFSPRVLLYLAGLFVGLSIMHTKNTKRKAKELD
jgi:hypothetical protein